MGVGGSWIQSVIFILLSSAAESAAPQFSKEREGMKPELQGDINIPLALSIRYFVRKFIKLCCVYLYTTFFVPLALN